MRVGWTVAAAISCLAQGDGLEYPLDTSTLDSEPVHAHFIPT